MTLIILFTFIKIFTEKGKDFYIVLELQGNIVKYVDSENVVNIITNNHSAIKSTCDKQQTTSK